MLQPLHRLPQHNILNFVSRTNKYLSSFQFQVSRSTRMKQETVIKVQMCCDKCRAKAMKVAASVEGVGSLAIKGEDKDHLVVIGENVDPVKLVRSLRKKVGHAERISLDKSEDNDGSGGGRGEDDKPKPESPRCPNYYPYLPPVIYIA